MEFQNQVPYLHIQMHFVRSFVNITWKIVVKEISEKNINYCLNEVSLILLYATMRGRFYILIGKFHR